MVPEEPATRSQRIAGVRDPFVPGGCAYIGLLCTKSL
ncbi:hypothetical protein AWB83_06299 [Caballeronia ptereochthonis]|uniref:Uncharacterized protein n=1 Tax=Caballeronia ptereochthonis TaxID=1777144 RepID=A0A158E4E0_9BURK|nr:hypothetical protein AWB83_06299 [Caballeronia ptereochthonis]